MPWLLPKWSQFTVLSWVTFSDICSNRPTGPQVHKIRPHQTRSSSGKNSWTNLMLYNILKVLDSVVFSHLKTEVQKLGLKMDFVSSVHFSYKVIPLPSYCSPFLFSNRKSNSPPTWRSTLNETSFPLKNFKSTRIIRIILLRNCRGIYLIENLVPKMIYCIEKLPTWLQFPTNIILQWKH